MAMHDATEAIWAFVILGSWTAFESLAGDLWVAGVDNDKGQAVANLTFASVSNKLKRPDDNLRPTTIYKSGINPKTNYGSFLRAVGSVTFQTLRDIKNYYEIAFGNDVARLFDEIENGYIEVLATFRNVITHSAGRADKKFVDRIHGRFPEFDSIKENDLLQPDGELANKLNTVAAKLGAELLAHIDDVLTPPETTI